MPGLLHVCLFRRISLFLSVMLAVLFLLQPVSNNLAHAAGAADSDTEQQQAYEQLKAGKRIWTDKTYIKPNQPTVYLTFDDGPSKLTDSVLEILREEGVTATFFVLGEQVEAYPGQVRQAVEDGHAIGNHTYNHKYNELYSSFTTFWQQIGQTEKALEEAAGVKPNLIRAPGGTFGNFDPFYFYYLDQAGYEVHDWNIDSGDAAKAGVPAGEIVRTVAHGPFTDEVIVLMHDGTGHTQTVKALPEIIRLFKDKGYAFAPLTSQVQPVRFSAGKSKWTRSVTPVMHKRLLAEAVEHRLALEQENAARKPAQQPEAGDRQEQQEQQEQQLTMEQQGGAVQEPLEVDLGSGKLFLQPGQYHLTDGHYQVPLRMLIEAMGGQADWREDGRTAAVRYGFRGIDYDFSRHEMRVNQGGDKTVYHLPQMELTDGTVYVPLRNTVELLGNRIVSFGSDKGHVRIEAALTGGHNVPYGF